MSRRCKHNEAGCAKQPVSIGVSWLSRRCKHNEAGCAKQPVSIGVSWLSRARIRAQNRYLEALKSIPGGFKIDPWRLQNRAKIAWGGQEAPQERPRASQERPRASQERPKSGPRAPKNGPRASKSTPRVVQERPREPKSAPGGLQKYPGGLWGRLLRLQSSKKPSFESALSRDSLEKRIRNDFRRVRASTGMQQTSKNLWFS